MKTDLEIYGTLGPSCADEAILRRMFAAGITGMRLNLSHGTLSDSAHLIDAFHSASYSEGVTPSLLIDMQGPELRIGMLGKGLTLEKGDEILLSVKGAAQTDRMLPVPEEIFAHFEPGMILMIDDGRIHLQAVSQADTRQEKRIKAIALNAGTILSRKSIAVRDKAITSGTLTGQDLMNLRCAGDAGVTDVMQPFVRGAGDLLEVRRAMRESGAGSCRLFAKIENRDGISAVDEIIPLADMVVIARGDLGNAVPLWELPRVQKQIAGKCLAANAPFMVVTQMLASMEHAPVPTRAEVSDIFNAVSDGASAVMITGESASGKYPVEASEYLVKTAREGLRWREKENNAI